MANKDLNGRTGPLKMANFRSDFVAHRSAKLNGNDDFGCTYLLYTTHYFCFVFVQNIFQVQRRREKCEKGKQWTEDDGEEAFY